MMARIAFPVDWAGDLVCIIISIEMPVFSKRVAFHSYNFVNWHLFIFCCFCCCSWLGYCRPTQLFFHTFAVTARMACACMCVSVLAFVLVLRRVFIFMTVVWLSDARFCALTAYTLVNINFEMMISSVAHTQTHTTTHIHIFIYKFFEYNRKRNKNN